MSRRIGDEITTTVTKRGTAGQDTRGIILTVQAPEDLSPCVVMLTRQFVETEEIDGVEMEVWLKAPKAKPAPKLARHLGTGFLVATATAAFLVTAAHVARRMDREAQLWFANRKGRRASLRLADLLSLGTRPIRWTDLPHADVAVVRIPNPPAAWRGHFLSAALLPSENRAPSGLFELMVLGFPLGLASEAHFTPIARRLHAASGMVRFRGDEMRRPADFFLLDQPAMGGYSGAPVFVAPQAQLTASGSVGLVEPRCVGLLSQTISSDEVGGQFAAVVPSAAIRRALARAKR